MGYGKIFRARNKRVESLGLNELFRVFFTTSKQFGSALGRALRSRFLHQPKLAATDPVDGGLLCFTHASLIGSLFLFRFINGKRLGRVLRMAPEKHEAFAAAVGVDYKRARITIFLLTSVALGFIGGFYAAQYRGVAYSIFDFQTVLLGLAMITIGGIGRAEGAVLGTLVVSFSRHFLEPDLALPDHRRRQCSASFCSSTTADFAFAGSSTLGVRKSAANGDPGVPRKAARRCPRRQPKSTTRIRSTFRRFDKMQRDYFEELIRPEIIEEHRPATARAAFRST